MTRAATGASPMPPTGQRALTGAQAQKRAAAMACLKEKSSECQGQICVNVFFDGTGNNRDWNGTFVTNPPKTRSTQTQLQRNGHSNVARLYDARVDDSGNGLFNVYIPGVGTPFPEVGDTNQEGSSLGAGAAQYGADRIHWAIIQVINAVNEYLTGAELISREHAKLLANEMSKTRLGEGYLRRKMLGAIATRLEGVVKGHQRKVKSLNISVFGFSRGAAQARAFVHRLYEVAEAWGSGCGHNIGGVPMTVGFMGIFDTVASVGLASMSRITEGKMAWADGEMMSIHPEVRKCIHFAALHEQRINFPLDLASQGTEVLYPGMHSDVGGGYSPGSQGKDHVGGRVDGTAKLSQIPLIDMHHEAIKAGVPIRTIEELEHRGLGVYFGCHPQLVSDYNAWLLGHGVAGGGHAAQIRAHCHQYVQWKGKRLWKGPDNLMAQPFYERADKEDQYDLSKAQQAFGNLVARYAQAKSELDEYTKNLNRVKESVRKNIAAGRPSHAVHAPAASSAANSYVTLNRDTKLLLDAVTAKKPLPDGVTVLFDNYAHDSLAGFYLMGGKTELTIPILATNGYLRYRGVFNVSSTIKRQECADLMTTPRPPAVLPTIDQALSGMGSAMGF